MTPNLSTAQTVSRLSGRSNDHPPLDERHYADVLRHALEEHTDSDELSEVMAGVTLPTPCGDCSEPFVSAVHISDGLRVRSYCDECAGSDPVLSVIYRRVSVEEILPEITEQNSKSAVANNEHS